MTPRIPEKMSNVEQLTNHLEAILKKIVEKNPALKNTSELKIKKLAETAAQVMLKKGIEFNRQDVIDENPKLMMKLTRALTLTKLEDSDKLFTDVKEILTNNKLSLDILKLKTVKELENEKKLTPNEAAKLDLLLKNVEKNVEKLQKQNLMQPTPKPKSGDPTPKINPLVVELLGVLLEGQTGSIQPVVTQFNGNYLGLDDKNPNNDLSQIGQQQRIDFMFGDPQGKQFDKMERFEATGCTFKELIEHAHNDIRNQPPKLVQGGGNSKL